MKVLRFYLITYLHQDIYTPIKIQPQNSKKRIPEGSPLFQVRLRRRDFIDGGDRESVTFRL